MPLFPPNSRALSLVAAVVAYPLGSESTSVTSIVSSLPILESCCSHQIHFIDVVIDIVIVIVIVVEPGGLSCSFPCVGDLCCLGRGWTQRAAQDGVGLQTEQHCGEVIQHSQQESNTLQCMLNSLSVG